MIMCAHLALRIASGFANTNPGTRCLKLPCLAGRQMAQKLTERARQRDVLRIGTVRKTMYRNGLRGCHFGRVRVNLWKTEEVSYLQTVGCSSTRGASRGPRSRRRDSSLRSE